MLCSSGSGNELSIRDERREKVLSFSCQRRHELERFAYAHGDDPLLGRHARSVLEAALLTEAVCYLLMLAGLGFDLYPDLITC